jgi:hypothetical protein
MKGETRCSVSGPTKPALSQVRVGSTDTRVEEGSNTSTVALRVVRGDEMGSLKSERVKYGRKTQGTRTREWLRWPAAHTKDRPVFSSETAPHGNKNVTVRQKQISGHEPQMRLDTKTYWLTDRQSQCDFDFWEDVRVGSTDIRVEAGSNTSTVAQRVVRGDKKGSLKSVKYGRESQGARTREWLRWLGPAAIVTDRPVLSSERAPHINKPATIRRQ